MQKKIKSALISVFYKDGLDHIVRLLHNNGVTIYSTGGTQAFIEKLDVPVVPVEQLTGYPSILGGRVKTLHPMVFGGVLGKRDDETHRSEMTEYRIPEIDLVIVDLYPFEETVATTSDEKAIIEKIDIGGPSMIRAAAKNFSDVVVIAAKKDYAALEQLLETQSASTTIEQRKQFAAKAFAVVAHYDVAIATYFDASGSEYFLSSSPFPSPLRYGENPHQAASFYGNTEQVFTKLNGKELSYNNLVDVDAAIQLMADLNKTEEDAAVFAIIKHTNVCGVASRNDVHKSWQAALAGDPESAFGGVLICNKAIDLTTAEAISEIFFEVLIAPTFEEAALEVLAKKKNRILLQLNNYPEAGQQFRSLLGGILSQATDQGNYTDWKEEGARIATSKEKEDLIFANIIAKHLKSNAIALVKAKQLVGKGCGQTSRIDSLRQSIEKAKQFSFDLNGAVMASDAFFPFNDCVKLGHEAGITAFIQPGGSIRDQDSISYCKENNLAMIITGLRHFRH